MSNESRDQPYGPNSIAGALPPCIRGAFETMRSLNPIVSLVVTVLLTIYLLNAVGYLSSDDDAGTMPDFESALKTALDATNVATRRGSTALSGILLASTVILSLTAFMWLLGNLLNRPRTSLCFVARRFGATLLAAGVIVLAIEWHPGINGPISFTSSLALKLLEVGAKQLSSAHWLGSVPQIMFWQGILLPLVLAFGASLFLEPMPQDLDRKIALECARRVTSGVRELDQMLYIGALALVCGTLQLSVALSVPLATMPSVSDVKTTADLCKALVPATGRSAFLIPSALPSTPPDAPASSAAGGTAAQAGATSAAPKEAAPFHRRLTMQQCEAVPTDFDRAAVATSVRSLIHALTLSIGLAFSLMLAAIYVPAMIQLREWRDEFGLALVKASESEVAPDANAKKDGIDLVDADPIRRIAAAFATLSPLIAGLVANTLTAG